MKQGMVSIDKRQEVAVADVLCICTQTNKHSDELCLFSNEEPA
jgi:hypothetical protein